MDPEARERLTHVRDAARTIIGWTASSDFGEYESDSLSSSACEYQLVIVGEALFRAFVAEPKLANDVSQGRAALAFCRKVTSDPWSLTDQEVWLFIRSQLPGLLSEVERLLQRPDSEVS